MPPQINPQDALITLQILWVHRSPPIRTRPHRPPRPPPKPPPPHPYNALLHPLHTAEQPCARPRPHQARRRAQLREQLVALQADDVRDALLRRLDLRRVGARSRAVARRVAPLRPERRVQRAEVPQLRRGAVTRRGCRRAGGDVGEQARRAQVRAVERRLRELGGRVVAFEEERVARRVRGGAEPLLDEPPHQRVDALADWREVEEWLGWERREDV